MLSLPLGDGGLTSWTPSGTPPVVPRPGGFRSRVAYAAAHVVADPSGAHRPDAQAVDWDATLSLRQHLWSLGLGVAEAMDTSQRGSGVTWETARELIRRTAAEAAGPAVYGAATDQLDPQQRFSLEEITRAYQEQIGFIESLGGQAIVMASRHLASAAQTADDYMTVYHHVITAADSQVMIHWLGAPFDPQLAGYWGADDPRVAAESVLHLLESHPGVVNGIKLSLLDPDLEVEVRRRLPPGIPMFTGDDLNYVELILGDDQGHSEALLGILGPIAGAATAAFQALDAGDTAGYRSLLEPTLPLARHMFSEPTYHYKTGVAFLAYLNGLQDHFHMVAGAEGDRSLPHLARILVLADRCGVLADADLAVHRMRLLLEQAGIDT